MSSRTPLTKTIRTIRPELELTRFVNLISTVSLEPDELQQLYDESEDQFHILPNGKKNRIRFTPDRKKEARLLFRSLPVRMLKTISIRMNYGCDEADWNEYIRFLIELFLSKKSLDLSDIRFLMYNSEEDVETVFTFLHLCSNDVENFSKICDRCLRCVNTPETSEGMTPLHMAYKIEIVRWLVDHGADIDALDKEGNTPIFYPWAFPPDGRDKEFDDEKITILYEKGATLFHENTKKELPIDVVHKRRLMRVFKLVQKYMVSQIKSLYDQVLTYMCEIHHKSRKEMKDVLDVQARDRDLTCPLSHSLFMTPVRVSVMTDTHHMGVPLYEQSGHSYERKAIERWSRDHDIDPLTRKRFIVAGLNDSRKMKQVYDFLLEKLESLTTTQQRRVQALYRQTMQRQDTRSRKAFRPSPRAEKSG